MTNDPQVEFALGQLRAHKATGKSVDESVSEVRKMNKLPEWVYKARNKWKYTGLQRPPFAVKPKEDQESVWDYPRPPAIEKEVEVVKVLLDESVIIETKNAIKMKETANPPTYYFPMVDVALDNFIKSEGVSWCEWKGKATHWALKSNPKKLVAWSYEIPFDGFEEIANYMSIYPAYFDCFIGSEKVNAQESEVYGGWVTKKLVGPFKGEKGSENW